MDTTAIAEKKVSELTAEELNQLLQQRQEDDRKASEKKRQAYEKKRNELVVSLVTGAKQHSEMLAAFKTDAFVFLQAFSQDMAEYGKLRTDNKGNFTITSADDSMRVVFRTQSRKEFDERAAMAEVHLQNFMETFVKVKNLEAFELISSLLQKNAAGQYDISLLHRLFKMEDRYDHQEWKLAISLFKQAFNEVSKASYITFYKRNEANAWELVNLNFSSINSERKERKKKKSDQSGG